MIDKYNELISQLAKAEENFIEAIEEAFKPFLETIQSEISVGDEIKCIEPLAMNYGMRYVVLRIGDEMKLLDPNTFAVHYSDNFGYFSKTGKHYESIPIPKEGENK